MCRTEKDIRKFAKKKNKELKKLLKKEKKRPLDCYGLNYLLEKPYSRGKTS